MVVDRFIFKNNQVTLSPCFTFIPKPGVGLPKTGVGFYCVNETKTKILQNILNAARVEVSTPYPCRAIHLLKIYECIFMCLCYIYEPWMSILVFSSEWNFEHGCYHGHCRETLTRTDDFYKCKPLMAQQHS